MTVKGKYIGVESRVHFDVLENAVVDYLLNGSFNKDKCLLDIKQYQKGENRAKKILKHVSVLISKQGNVLDTFRKLIKEQDYYQLKVDERKAFLLSLFCLSFPITFEILIAIGQGFKVQSNINKMVIKQKIGSLYGGNRAADIAVTEIIPFLIECGVLQRIKVGLYAPSDKLTIGNKSLIELIVYTDIVSSRSKSINVEDIHSKPWFSFFKLSDSIPERFKSFVIRKDSSIGKGYLTVNL